MIRRLWPRRGNRAAAVAVRPVPPPAEVAAPCRLGPFTLRAAGGPSDRQLLLEAYTSSRCQDMELQQRHPDSRAALIEHEFESRQLGYPVDFPGVEFFLLDLDGQPAGRLYLQPTPAWIFVVDVVLLPPFRGHGHGTALLRQLIDSARASGRGVRLHVARNNPRAAALYQRLGFQPIGALPHHELLAIPPPE